MREIYLYGYSERRLFRPFEGFGMHSPLYQNTGLTMHVRNQGELESWLDEYTSVDDAMIINEIPATTYARARRIELDYGGSPRLYFANSQEDFDDFMRRIDFPRAHMLTLIDSEVTREYRMLDESELTEGLRSLLFRNQPVDPSVLVKH